MSEPARLENPVRVDPARSKHAASPVRRFGADHWSSIAVIALALLLWAPRFSGPIDLRWDAGVYYLLGTSLAKGEGYRIASEPGSPEALQYPPLLPALVALHQWALGTTDPAIVAPWLRSSYAGPLCGLLPNRARLWQRGTCRLDSPLRRPRCACST